MMHFGLLLSWLQYKPKTLNPVWLEQFNLHMYEDQTSHVEISVWDHDAAGKDDIMGRSVTLTACNDDNLQWHVFMFVWAS